MFNTFMNTLEKISAKVELVLDDDDYHLCDEISGEVIIKGGLINQTINHVYVELNMLLTIQDKLLQQPIYQENFPSFPIGSSEEKRVPIRYTLPHHLSHLGFQEYPHSRLFDGYFQEFKFTPTLHYRKEMEEISLNVVIDENGLHVFLEAKLTSNLNYKNVYHELFLDHRSLQHSKDLAYSILQALTEMISNPCVDYKDKKKFYDKQSFLIDNIVDLQ